MLPVKPWLPIVPQPLASAEHDGWESRMGKKNPFCEIITASCRDRRWKGENSAEKFTYEKSGYTKSNTFPLLCQATPDSHCVLQKSDPLGAWLHA